MTKTNDLTNLIKNSVRESFQKAGVNNEPKAPAVKIQEAKVAPKRSLKENLILLPKTFLLKTEFLSAKTKETHEKLYKTYTDTVNKVSSLLNAVNPEEASSFDSAFRSLKIDEQDNLNASKLHDLYFANISDQASQIAVDSLPYMRLARDFGTFDRWQFDFRGCALAAREGWAVCYYEPMKNSYMNCVVDGHSTNIPLGGVPVFVMDMWGHAYYRDYLDDKKSYVNAMMREANWNVVEARMVVAEKSGVGDVFRIQPVQNSVPGRILATINADSVPIASDQVQSSEVTGNQPAPQVGDQGTPRGSW